MNDWKIFRTINSSEILSSTLVVLKYKQLQQNSFLKYHEMNVVNRVMFKLIQYAGSRADDMVATFTIINEIDQMLNILSDFI